MLGCKCQKQNERLDYDIDFSRWLPDGDAIAEVFAVSSGLDIEATQNFSPIVKLWISGGAVGKTYKVEVSATTSSNRVKEESFNIRISEC